jgi:hypothetical protein
MLELAFLVAMGAAFLAIFRRCPPEKHPKLGQLPASLDDKKENHRDAS